MKRSAENWIAQIKLQRQARRLARCAVASLVVDGRHPRAGISNPEDGWWAKIRNAFRKSFFSGR